MKYFIWSLAVLILLLLQVAILKPLHLLPANIVLVFLILTLLFDGFSTALIVAIVGGIMLDFLAGTNLGLMTLSLLLILALGQALFELFLSRSPSWLMTFGLIAVGSLIFGVCFLAVNSLFWLFYRGVAINFTGFWLSQLWQILFNLILAYPLFKYLSLTQWIYAQSLRNRK